MNATTPPRPPTVVEPEPVVWRYQDSRGHYRYRSYVPGFDAKYAILKPVPLYLATPPRAALSEQDANDLALEVVKGGKSVQWLIRKVEAAHNIGGSCNE